MKKNTENQKEMQIHFPNVAGIDIGAKSIFVAVPSEDQELEVKEFGTTTPELRKIVLWLKEANIESAAMESTGVYWIPLFEILEDAGFKAILVDAKSVKNVPGRKTDVLDCQWIQKLFSYGLLTPAFRPPKEREAFRSYLRHRENLVESRQTSILHMQKALLLMNIKLDVAVSDVTGVTGLTIIRSIIGGERDPKKLALLRNYRCRKSEEEFIAALDGNYQETHLFALKQAVEIYDFFAKKIEECDEAIKKELENWKTIKEEAVPVSEKDKRKVKNSKYKRALKPKKNEFNFDMREVLYQKTGVDLTIFNGIEEATAAVIISELGGANLDAFKTEKHFASWLGLCPGNKVSGGKSLSGRSKKCKNRIKHRLCLAAMTLSKSKCALGAYYRKLSSRIGKAKAIKAVAHRLCKLIFRSIKYGTAYVEIGQEAYEKQYEMRRLKYLQKCAREMGFELKKKEPV